MTLRLSVAHVTKHFCLSLCQDVAALIVIVLLLLRQKWHCEALRDCFAEQVLLLLGSPGALALVSPGIQTCPAFALGYSCGLE